ncbi:MAG: peptidyl-prolyl cis-trans isomerase [Candidatus Omnitrophica bacterium]|nr:peptidyl-prolyl cis-trans isomerase [Candidatus Omnitrophota bacterium]
MLLKFLRKRKNMKRIIWGLAILIIPAFVIWGAGSSGNKNKQGPDYAGKIFGKKISFEDYADMWRVTRDYALRTFGANVPPELIDQLAWNRLILLEEIKREKIAIKDSEVVEKIMSFPVFQRDGLFDKQIYKSMVGDAARGFEERIRDDIRISKLRERVTSGVTITDEEVREEYDKKFEKIKASYVSMLFKEFEKEVDCKEADLLELYNQNKDTFRKPEAINVEYVGVLFSSFDKEVPISEEAVRKYFEETIDAYKKPDSEELPELTEDIKKSISDKLAMDRKMSLAEELAYKVLDAARDKNDLGKATGSFGLEKNETGFFSMQDEVPGIGWSYEFTKTGFELKKGQISDVLVKTGKGFYIIRLADKRESYIPGFTEAKESVMDLYVKNASVRLAEKKAKKTFLTISRMIKSGKTFNSAYQAFSLEQKQTELITRDSYISALGPAAGLVESCASLKPGEISPPVKMQDSWVIARLDEYQAIDENKFMEERESFRENILARKKQEVFDKWFEELKERAGLITYTGD